MSSFTSSTRRGTYLLWALFVFFPMLLAGCDCGTTPTAPDGSQPDSVSTTDKTAVKRTSLRVIHMSYDAPAVDVQVGGATAISSLSYGDSSGYSELDTGSVSWSVTPSGQTEPKLLSGEDTLADTNRYTILAINKADSVQSLVLEDPLTPNPDKVLLRVIHASPDAPGVDIRVGSNSATPLVSSLEFGKSTKFLEIDEGEYALVLTPAGQETTVVAFEPVKLEKGRIYTVIARGTLDDKDSVAFGVRAFVDNGDGKSYVDLVPKKDATKDKALVRVIHASYDAPDVDISVDGTKAITGLGYKASSGYKEVDAGDRQVTVTPAGKDSPVVIDEKLTLEKETSYTVFALNKLDSITALATKDEREPSAQKAKIRLVHASPDAPAVDVKPGSATAQALFGDVAFGKATSYLEVDPGKVSLVITAANGDKAVVSFEEVELEAGKVYTALAHGTLDANDNVPFGVRVFVDNGDGTVFVDLKIKGAQVKEEARVRVLHMSYDGPAVDLKINGQDAIKQLAYKTSSGYATLPAGKQSIDILDSSNGATVLSTNLTLDKDKEYTVIALNEVSALEVVSTEDARKPSAQKARVRLVHASPDAPAVDVKVGSATGTRLFTNVAFKGISKYQEVDEGSYSLVITATGSDKAVIRFEPIKVEKGKVYTAVAHGTLDSTDKFDFGVRVFVDNGDGKSFVDLKPVTTTPVQDKARIRVIHTSYNAPAVDIAVDGTKAISNLAFKASSGYATLNAGSRKVTVTPAGRTTPVVINATLPLAKDTDYTVFAFDQLSKIAAGVTTDARTPDANRAKVRFVHASPDAPAVDIRAGSGTATPVFANRAFKSISSYITVPEGSYSFYVTPAGKTNVVVSYLPVKLEKGKVYTVVAHGTLNATDKFNFGVRAFVDNGDGKAFVDLNARVTNPPTPKAKVRVLHMSYDAPAVDIAVDGTKAISNLAFKTSSGYATLNAGSRRVTVTPAGRTTPVVINTRFTLAKDTDYTVVAINKLSAITTVADADARTPDANRAKIRFIHASPDAPAVDIRAGSGTGTRVFANARFGTISKYITVAEGSYSFFVTPAGRTNVVVSYLPVRLEKGKVYTVVAHGTLNATDRYNFGVRAFVDNGDGKAFVDLTARAPQPVGKAKVRVIHGSYDAPAVDVAVDGTKAISNLAYRASSGYATLNAGTRRVTVTPAGRTTPVVINANLNLAKDAEYTVFAMGKLSSIGPVVVQDRRTTTPAFARVRFVHASPDAPAVDIRVGSATGARLFAGTRFRQATGYISVLQNSYSLFVNAAGSSQAVVGFQPVRLERGKAYTVVAFGTLNSRDSYPFGVRVFVDNGDGKSFIDLKPIVTTPTKAKVRVIHASYDAPAVDVAVDGTKAITNLAYKVSSGYAEVNPGARRVTVTPAGRTSPTVINATLTLAAGTDYTVFAVNRLSSIRALATADARTPDPNRAKVRFVHASPDAPAVDIRVGSGTGTRVFANAAFGRVTSYITVAEGSYSFFVTPAGRTTVVKSYNAVRLEKGKVYTVVALGTLSSTDAVPFGVRAFVDNGDGKAFVDLQERTVTPPRNRSNFRFIHANYRYSQVDVFLNSTRVSDNLPYRATSGYRQVTSGRYGLRSTSGFTTLLNTTISMSSTRDYTFTVVNSSNRTVLISALDARAPKANVARVRFIHASTDAPAVDIKVGSATGTAVFRNAAFRSVSSYIDVTPGSLSLVVTPAGSSTAVVAFEAFKFEAGKVYTFMAQGTLSSSDNVPFVVRAFNDGGTGDTFTDLQVKKGTARVNVSHMIPANLPVDVFVDGTRVLRNVNYPANSGYLNVASGNRAIQIRRAGSTTVVATINALLVDKASYTAFALSNGFGRYRVVLSTDDLTAPASGRVKVRVVHASPSTPSVDVFVRGGARLFRSVSYGSVTSFITVNAGTYNFDIRRAGRTQVLLRASNVRLSANRIYTIIARGTAFSLSRRPTVSTFTNR